MRIPRLIAALVVCGCAPVLMPGAGAVRVPGAETFTFTEVGGVRVWASGADWDGAPASLPEVMTPVAVTIENRSGRQLRLTSKDFTLSGKSGVRYAALPPYPAELRGEGPVAFEVTLVDYHPAVPPPPRPPPPPHRRPARPDRFWLAHPSVRFHLGVPLWPGPWLWWDAAYHRHWYSTWPTALPSQDMLRRALPDGALDDGGTVSGFVYFQQVGREAVVDLEFELHDATTGEGFGTARLPFVVRR